MVDSALKVRLAKVWKTPDSWVFLIPFVYYAVLTRFEITYGDGPELLTAAHALGVPHPSGYPLWTLLGHLPSHFPVGTPFWNVALTLSAVPTALAAWAIYATLRHLGAGLFIGVVSAWVWAFNYHVVYQATRIEVYGLHCGLIALAIWALVRFTMPQASRGDAGRDDASVDLRWAYAAVAFTCLALTNHLTSSFLVLPVVLGMLATAPREVSKLRPILTMTAIAAACAAVYVYLPLSAMANVGDRVTWNDPQTLERFWFHVTGQEYSIFRRFDKILPTLTKYWNSLNTSFFPGVAVLVGIGAVEWFLKHWRSLACVALFEASYLAYVGTYPIRDVSTYYTALFIPVVLGMGMGIDWLLRVRFPADTKSRRLEVVQVLVMAVLAAWIIGLMYYSRANHYREALAEDMSERAMEQMEDPAIVFTSVDGHTFPMWYQVYVEQPDRKVAVIDTVMFHLENKQWYRDSLRAAYPWIEWPPDDVALGSRWRQWIVDHNPDVNIYAFLDRRWPERGSYPELLDWHHRIHDGRADPSRASTRTRHAYLARAARVNGHTYFFDSGRRYEAGEERIACVAEWWKHNDDFAAAWRFFGPDGELISSFPRHDVPEGSTQSWEFLEIDQQRPGRYRCEIDAPGEPLIVREFVLE